LIFRVDLPAEHSLAQPGLKKWFKQFGVELFYGTGMPTVLGDHPDGTTYRLDGTLTDAPDWLLAMLEPPAIWIRPPAVEPIALEPAQALARIDAAVARVEESPDDFHQDTVWGAAVSAGKALELAGDEAGISQDEVREQLIQAAANAGTENMVKVHDAVRRGLEAGRELVKAPVEANGHANGSTNGMPKFDMTGLTDTHFGIIRLKDIKSRPNDWLWKYRLERGTMALLAGDGGIGKSQLLLWIARTISIGGAWPDNTGSAVRDNVVILSAEDDPESTIKPRLVAMGADADRIFLTKATWLLERKDKPPLVSFKNLQDIEYWQKHFQYVGDVVAFIVDPLPSYLGRGVNDSKNTEVREILEPFITQVIRPFHICMIGNTHLNKTVDAKTPMHRITGSIAYNNVPRNVHFVARDPDDPALRYFKQAKCNDAPDDLPALAFRVEKTIVKSDGGEDIETATPKFEANTVDVNLNDMVNGRAGVNRRGPTPDRTREVAEWLHDTLRAAGGTMSAATLYDAAGAKGFLGERKGREWTGKRTLLRARDYVPTLDAPRNGKRIDVHKPTRAHAYWRWQLV
jgi:hypothetical protein